MKKVCALALVGTVAAAGLAYKFREDIGEKVVSFRKFLKNKLCSERKCPFGSCEDCESHDETELLPAEEQEQSVAEEF
ncbi:hypothetical protein PCE1_002385 [Barthelona sp. PCE]